jgi:hypothetical protein
LNRVSRGGGHKPESSRWNQQSTIAMNDVLTAGEKKQGSLAVKSSKNNT